MSVAPRAGNGKVTVPDILSRKSLSLGSLESNDSKRKISCLTAYDYPTARLLDEAGVDVLLVGDSLGMAVLGYDSTLPVTIDDIVYHTRAVRRGTRRALLVADMPYGSFHVSIEEIASQRRAPREGRRRGSRKDRRRRAAHRADRKACEAEIPVMGHIGLTPQSLHALGGFQVQGKTAEAARQVERDARAVEAAGAFSVVLESMPRDLAARITAKLRIPTIGIGAGPDCDGQILVFHDLVGLTIGHKPKFVRQYADLSAEVSRAVSAYCDDVREGRFPSDAESYHSPAELRERVPAPQRP